MSSTGKSILHESFEVGISLKGVGGLLEVFGGLVLGLLKPSDMNEIVRRICAILLVEFPHIASHVLDASQRWTDYGGTRFASLYLLSHGVVKVALVICLWMNKLWAYPLTIVVFTLFVVYQLHRFTHTHSWTLIALSVFDAVIIYLTWQEYQEQKTHKEKK
ncbi:MAG: DUF2127 domain-containing protein [Candidatus Acidiferrales bacterium]